MFAPAEGRLSLNGREIILSSSVLHTSGGMTNIAGFGKSMSSKSLKELLKFYSLLFRQWGSSIVNHSILEILGICLDFNWYIAWNVSSLNIQKSEKIRFSLWEGMSQDCLHLPQLILFKENSLNNFFYISSKKTRY